MELTNIQAAVIAEAAAKDMKRQAEAFRAKADADIMDTYKTTGAKTFDVALDTGDRRVPIGTASVVSKDGTWQIVDFDAWADGAADAGELLTTFTVDAEHAPSVHDVLEAAGLIGCLQVRETPAEKWQEHTAEVAGVLVWTATGCPVEGVEWTSGKTYTMLRPKSIDLINKAARALFGSTPLALLEGETNG